MNELASYIQAVHDVYPSLLIETCNLNRQGQFNDVLVINGEYIFRFPKTQREVLKLDRETRLLQHLQSRVTLSIPNPIYRSKDVAPPGRAFMGYRLLPGEPFWPGTFSSLKDEGQLQHLATQLALFLRQLHCISAEELGVKLPEFQGCAEWREMYERFRSKLFPFMRPDACVWVTKHFEDFLSDERNCSYVPALIHGDFGPSNILYDAQTGSISGILDFSSAGWGDPALDFAALSGPVSYPESFLERFSGIYPGIDTLLSRSRFYTGTFALQEALYGIEDNDQKAFESGIASYR
ncbi:6'-aminoglycoside N-acetyltransferase [Reticulibacter mediterranei]|uniref:6'-aminoglycoside N-acetyltransferase n=1 Tax=Reticulibacter mediterranei TaxID=2778369 RepID=A0A8J3IEB5_9CHLR|nr:aminoglycoside phosphotransferase family protein [Reticulibacter mediterranei]GHO91998.1 6'-aminoglycoside N-acetyltransferase [Reticulibacter mediterranei]